MKSLLALVLLLLIVQLSSCKEQQASTETEIKIEAIGNDTLQIPSPSNLKPIIRLTPQAQKGVENWSFYRDLTIAVDSLPGSSLGTLKMSIQRFNALYNIQEEVEEAEVQLTPETVKTKAIQARLIALESKAKILNNDIHLNTPDVFQIATKIGQVHNAYQDLNLQLNERFDTSFKDLLEEIKNEGKEAAVPDGTY